MSDSNNLISSADPMHFGPGACSDTDTGETSIFSSEMIDFLCQIGPPTPPPAVTGRRSQLPDPASQLIGTCGGCRRDLPWPTPRAGLWAAPVACPQCGRWYFTEGRNDSQPELTGRAISEQSRNETLANLVQRQSDSIARLLDHLVSSGTYLGPERRRSTRINLSQPVVTVPLGRDARPISEAEDQTLCDLSEGGAGLLGESAVEPTLVLIDFSPCASPGLQLLARVAWRETKGSYARTGCEFLHDPTRALPLK